MNALKQTAGPSNTNNKKNKGVTSQAQRVTRILVECNVGFGNHLCIRGEGCGLSWEKGQPLQNLSHNQWVWEHAAPFQNCFFKVLINDHQFETGENRTVQCGDTCKYTPRFE